MLNRVFPSRIAGIVDRKSKRSQFLDQLSAPWNYTNKDRWGDRVIAAASNSVVLVVGSVASSSWVVNWKNDEWWWMDCISGSFGYVTSRWRVLRGFIDFHPPFSFSLRFSASSFILFCFSFVFLLLNEWVVFFLYSSFAFNTEYIHLVNAFRPSFFLNGLVSASLFLFRIFSS